MPSVPLIRSTFDGTLPGRFEERLLLRLVRAALWPVRVMRARTALAEVAGLSDRELRDIGLTREDVRNATALPLDEDPTRFLAVAARRRRGARDGRGRSIQGRP